MAGTVRLKSESGIEGWLDGRVDSDLNGIGWPGAWVIDLGSAASDRPIICQAPLL